MRNVAVLRSVATAPPGEPVEQELLKGMLSSLWVGSDAALRTVLNVFETSGVKTRHLALPLDEYPTLETFARRNARYVERARELEPRGVEAGARARRARARRRDARGARVVHGRRHAEPRRAPDQRPAASESRAPDAAVGPGLRRGRSGPRAGGRPRADPSRRRRAPGGDRAVLAGLRPAGPHEEEPHRHRALRRRRRGRGGRRQRPRARTRRPPHHDVAGHAGHDGLGPDRGRSRAGPLAQSPGLRPRAHGTRHGRPARRGRMAPARGAGVRGGPPGRPQGARRARREHGTPGRPARAGASGAVAARQHVRADLPLRAGGDPQRAACPHGSRVLLGARTGLHVRRRRPAPRGRPRIPASRSPPVAWRARPPARRARTDVSPRAWRDASLRA